MKPRQQFVIVRAVQHHKCAIQAWFPRRPLRSFLWPRCLPSNHGSHHILSHFIAFHRILSHVKHMHTGGHYSPHRVHPHLGSPSLPSSPAFSPQSISSPQCCPPPNVHLPCLPKCSPPAKLPTCNGEGRSCIPALAAFSTAWQVRGAIILLLLLLKLQFPWGSNSSAMHFIMSMNNLWFMFPFHRIFFRFSMYPDLPPPTYAESVWGVANVRRQVEVDHWYFVIVIVIVIVMDILFGELPRFTARSKHRYCVCDVDLILNCGNFICSELWI